MIHQEIKQEKITTAKVNQIMIISIDEITFFSMTLRNATATKPYVG